MRLLLKLKDMCYYEYKGEIIWVYNKEPFRERKYNERIKEILYRR